MTGDVIVKGGRALWATLASLNYSVGSGDSQNVLIGGLHQVCVSEESCSYISVECGFNWAWTVSSKSCVWTIVTHEIV